MTSRPHVRIVNDSGLGPHTRIYDENGAELTCVTAVTWKADMAGHTTATLDVIAVEGELQAEVEAIRVKVVPEPAPKPQLKLRIGPYQFNTGLFAFELTRLNPLPAYGVATEKVAEGMVELREGALDRVYEFVIDAPE